MAAWKGIKAEEREDLTREETRDLVNACIIDNDQEAFERFHKQFDGCVFHIAQKYAIRINIASFGLYDLEDIMSEIWEFVWYKLPQYDHTRAGMVTWLYLMANSRAGKILRRFRAQIHGDGKYVNSFNVLVPGKEDKDVELIDTYLDPLSAFENRTVEQYAFYEYLYTLNLILIQMSQKEKIVYLNRMRGMKQHQVAEMIYVSQVQVSRIHRRVIAIVVQNFEKLKNSSDFVDPLIAIEFAEHLLSDETDDDLSDLYDYDLGSIKICREIISQIDIEKEIS